MKDKIYYKDKTVFEGEWDNAPHHRDSSKIIHREDGPAVELANGDKAWFLNGQCHREDGPAVENANGKEWYLNDQRHRIDGPAVEWFHGYKEWCQNDKLHREDGPAVECIDGTKSWWLDGKLHREDGPVTERAYGHKEWCLNGKKYSKKEYLNLLKEIDSLEPAIGLTDTRAWVRNRWKKRFERER